VRSIIMTLLGVLMAISVASAADRPLRDQLAEDSVIEQALKRGTLRVGFSTFVPWAMQDKSGAFVGFEVDVATRLAQDLGLNLELVPTKWSGIIPALLTGKFDVIIGGMSVKPVRSLKVNFTIPYDYASISVMASKSAAAGLKSLDDFDNPEVVVVARTGSTAALAAKKRFPKARLRYFDDEGPAIQEVLSGRAHALVSSDPLPRFEVLANPDRLFMPEGKPLALEPVAFAVRKSDPDTLNVLDNWIRMVEMEGWLKERKHYWFETRDWEPLVR